MQFSGNSFLDELANVFREIYIALLQYSKTCVKRPPTIDTTKIFMTNGSLMKVESIADSAVLLTCIKR